jgi:hypothetical protein
MFKMGQNRKGITTDFVFGIFFEAITRILEA